MPVYQSTNSGNNRALIANRLAHFFDFKGTSITGRCLNIWLVL